MDHSDSVAIVMVGQMEVPLGIDQSRPLSTVHSNSQSSITSSHHPPLVQNSRGNANIAVKLGDTK